MDQKKKAIYFQLITVFLLIVMNMLAKVLSEDQEVVAILFYRNVIAFSCIAGFILVKKRFDLLKTKRPMLHVKRSISGNISVFFVFTAFSMLPMADMTALMLSTPLVATILAVFLLKESITWQKLCTILLGFIGVVIIVKPTGAIALEGAIIACIAVLFVAWINVQLRGMGKTEQPLTTVFYFFLSGMIMTSVFMPFVYKPLQGNEFLLIAGLVFVVIVSQILKTEAMRHADVSTLTPLSYTGIIWATIFGWLIWGNFPDWTVYLGASIIIMSSLLSMRVDKILNTRNSK